MAFAPSEHPAMTSSHTSPHLQFAICTLQLAIAFSAIDAPCGAAARVEAYRGETFGIGRVTLDLLPVLSAAPPLTTALHLPKPTTASSTPS